MPTILIVLIIFGITCIKTLEQPVQRPIIDLFCFYRISQNNQATSLRYKIFEQETLLLRINRSRRVILKSNDYVISKIRIPGKRINLTFRIIWNTDTGHPFSSRTLPSEACDDTLRNPFWCNISGNPHMKLNEH